MNLQVQMSVGEFDQAENLEVDMLRSETCSTYSLNDFYDSMCIEMAQLAWSS